ncbi:hypothetical protein O3G_MSEX010046 [Manduca sexta]|uniref:Chromo domain-containing protein n=1 Tax=Manduca sexta TaxID=7130 RepID=A0A921ZGM0_MANSE|nr:hypothetical protein O3G_MSEX010046 [Manduca sexta]
MTSMEESESPPEEVPPGNPEELSKNPTALKEAHELMSTLDVLVCGQCHAAFHFVDEFKEHKDANNCSGKSPVRDSNESKAQVWAFLLWKCSSTREGTTANSDNSWKLYQQWCRMPEAQRNAWITAGSNMEVKTEDQLVPVQNPPQQEVRKRGRPRKIPKVEPNESVRNAQERVPPEERIARRTERQGDPTEAGEYVVEKILAKRFNPRRKQYEYLLKWEGYPHEQNTWEPIENMETCKHLLEAFEKQLARQKELKALRAQQQQQQHPVQVKQISTPLPQVVKQVVKKSDSPAMTPTGRLQRTSKVRALDQVKAWCGGEDGESVPKKVKKEMSSEDEEFSDSDSKGVYIMSKSSGIMKIDAPGKLGPGLSLDQDIIRKQIMAAKQKKVEETKKSTTSPRTPMPSTQVKKTYNSGGQQVTEKTIITPSGQKIIQRTIQRPSSMGSDGKSPVTILNKKLAQGDSLLRRGGSARGRGRGAYAISTAGGNIVRIRDKTPQPIPFDFDQSDASSDTSDGIEDPFPRDLGPLPADSPERELTLCPLTGRRLARAEGEPTPPPTPSPPPEPAHPTTPPPHQPTVVMKVEMSPGGTTGMLVQGDGAQPSLPVLTDEDGTEVKVEASAVKQLLEEGVGVDEGDEVSLLHTGHPPIMIRGEDGVLYQVAGENEAGQTLLVAAEGVEGAVEGVEGAVEGEGDVMYVTREDGQDVLSLDPSQLAQLMPGGEAAPALQQVAVQVEGEPGEDATQVIAQLLQADLPSPGGTRRVVLLLPDGTLTMTELDKEQYESITEASKAQE